MRNNLTMNQSSNTTTTVTETNTEVRPILKLRNHKKPNKVKWTEETVDNENMGKKKTKICCIYHPADGAESCSSSESESDASDFEGDGDAGPNAYEKQPQYKK
ncbi:type 1 phosphatases regulator Ypi1p [[Candida] jaroonii]|uniref:Type 1 phosphatases regulator Ypi1p n=1 Tax=[Candida] jaroonii TaxID=467808 RepID=A0ACA9Y6C0_9ASCO|nr:type 1 phosphatases regulator Ypi1p [[Candida] jaroonii]